MCLQRELDLSQCQLKLKTKNLKVKKSVAVELKETYDKEKEHIWKIDCNNLFIIVLCLFDKCKKKQKTVE